MKCTTCGREFETPLTGDRNRIRCPYCQMSQPAAAALGTEAAGAAFAGPQPYSPGAAGVSFAPAASPGFARGADSSEASANPYQAPRVGNAPPNANVPYVWGMQRHRGSTILTLGIVSCALALIGAVICNLLQLVSLILGITAITMANHDRKAMASGSMDRSGQGQTTAGMILGIIGTVLSALLLVAFVVIMVFYVMAVARGAAR